jgi:hypothetical protein
MQRNIPMPTTKIVDHHVHHPEAYPVVTVALVPGKLNHDGLSWFNDEHLKVTGMPPLSPKICRNDC